MKRRGGVSLQPREEVSRPAKRLRRQNIGGDPLRGWVLDHLDADLADEEVEERCSALVEVGQVLIAERDRYPGEKEMREEVEELVTQLISAEAVSQYVKLCLSLRPPHHHAVESQPVAGLPHPHPGMLLPHHPPLGFPVYPGGMMPHAPFPLFDPLTGMPLFHPGGFPGGPPGGPIHEMGQHQPGGSVPQSGRTNLVFSKTGEPTAVQKLREREAKRKELLHELTEQLKTLVAKASEQTDASQRQKYLGLIEGIKKRITALSTTTAAPRDSKQQHHPAGATVVDPATDSKAVWEQPQQTTTGAGTGAGAGVVGYFSNAYVNPELLKKEEQKKIDDFNARLAKAKANKQHQQEQQQQQQHHQQPEDGAGNYSGSQ